MVYRGHVENSLIRLDHSAMLPEGVAVEVRLLAEPSAREEQEEIPSLYDRLKDVVGKAEGLPPDLAENHDHYLHFQARR
ncbi:MAG: hypothetical protein ACLQLG_12120 [Thermoguttaceae bacterium]